MNETVEEVPSRETPTEDIHHLQILSYLAFGAFWVTFLWGFWHSGVYALGLNASIFLFGVFALVYRSSDESAQVLRQGRSWIIPILLMCSSFALFENPFIKVINFLVIPLTWSLFYRYGAMAEERGVRWRAESVLLTLSGTMLFPQFWALSATDHCKIKCDRLRITQEETSIFFRVIQGFTIFAVLALFVVLPLLISADEVFSQRIGSITEWFRQTFVEFFRLSLIMKCICLFMVSSAVGGAIRYVKHLESWKIVDSDKERKVDSIVSGVVLIGILMIYVLFIWVQLEKLWLTILPTNFSQSERIAKEGFWQLVFLSLVNILLFTWCFRRTNQLIQFVLSLFTAACLILVLSAGNKMWLYVTTYGLSYEKFYASYTVLFCFLVFIYLLRALFVTEKLDTIKATSFLFLWMYGIVTVLPVERFVLRSNLLLLKGAESRIRLDELTMLSADVYPVVVSYSRDPEFANQFWTQRWSAWISGQADYLKNKRWYERSFSTMWVERE